MRDQGTYNKKIRFYVIDITSPKIEQEVARWEGLGNHGLVGTTAQRVLKVKIPGHNFGKAAIIRKADELLAN